MGPRGRPRLDGTDEERAEVRRARVRLHVQAYRRRQKEKLCQDLPILAKRSITIIFEDPGRKQLSQSKANASTKSVRQSAKHDSTRTDNDEHALQRYKAQLPIPVDEGPAYRGSFLNALLDRYLSNALVPVGLEGMLEMFRYGGRAMPVTCSRWVIVACTSATYEGAEVLSESMLCMALCIIGAERNDSSVLMTGLRTYQRALTRVQKEISAFHCGDAVDSEVNPGFLPLSCLACALTELMANKSMKSFSNHLDGIAMIIQRSGPTSLDDLTMRALFYEHRSIYIAFSFVDRRSFFYSKHCWIDFTWKAADKSASSYVQTLLDIAYLIPGLMEEYDSTLIASVESLQRMMKSARQFDLLLDHWKTVMETSIVVPVVTLTHTESEESFSDQITFASIGLATAMGYYWTVKIHLNHLLADIANKLLLHDVLVASVGVQASGVALDYARKISQAMEFWFAGDSGLLGKLVGLLPFDAMWHAFTRANEDPGVDLTRELDFCQNTARRYRQMGFTLFKER